MGLVQRLTVGHHHDRDAGGVITHPRAYELFANAWFLGQRLVGRLRQGPAARQQTRNQVSSNP